LESTVLSGIHLFTYSYNCYSTSVWYYCENQRARMW